MTKKRRVLDVTVVTLNALAVAVNMTLVVIMGSGCVACMLLKVSRRTVKTLLCYINSGR